MAQFATPIPTAISAYGASLAAARGTDPAKLRSDKAREAAQDFESVFLNSMFSQMFTEMDGEGPFGGGREVGIWRSFLTDEYAKTFTKAGGIGIADQVYRTLLQQQEQAGPAAGAIR